MGCGSSASATLPPPQSKHTPIYNSQNSHNSQLSHNTSGQWRLKTNNNNNNNNNEDDDFDIHSNAEEIEEGMMRPHLSEALSTGDEDVPNLATFYNQPQECYYCHSAAVTYACEQCENFYVCDECMCNGSCTHNPRHAISALHETQSNNSRTFGSSVGTVDGGVSSLFYDPCTLCNRVILDTERVFQCFECNVVVCTLCFQRNGNDAHEHVLKPFQRSIRSNTPSSSALINKSRTSDGNKVINDYVVVKLLGRGAYAKVNLVQHHRDHTLYALKILRRNRMNKSKRFLTNKIPSEDDLLREIAVMKFVSHPNLVELKEVIDDTEAQKIYVIMEYCEKGPVYTYGNPPLALEKVRKYARDIMSGLLHLHGEYLYHRDIKPANCLIDGKDIVKIADFGTCGSQMKNAKSDGTPAYTCPELHNGLKASGEIVDSWAFAVTLFQISHGYLPVSTENVGGLRQSLLGPQPLEISNAIDAELQDVLSKMLDKDASKRMLLGEAVQHPFFQMENYNNNNNNNNNSKIITSPRSNSSRNDFSMTQSELYSKGVKSVLSGKGLSECYHGMRTLKRIRGKSVRYGVDSANDIEQEEKEKQLEQLEEERKQEESIMSRSRNNMEHGVKDRLLTARDSITNYQTSEIDVNQIISIMLECQGNGELQIVNLPLPVLPPFIADAALHTSHLRLSSNSLSSMSGIDFSRFTLLRDIVITNNFLTEFPVEILQAPYLGKLDLSHNRIVDVPSDITRARLLSRISLQNNCIKNVGTDEFGNSVFSGRCLRHVRLSGNPLQHLPEALHTCPNLELIIDDSPVLVNEFENILPNIRSVVVVWNDIYPHQISPEFPVFIASKNINLYTLSILTTIGARHVVLPHGENWLPLGCISVNEMEKYIYNTHSGVNNNIINNNIKPSSLANTITTASTVSPILSPHIIDTTNTNEIIIPNQNNNNNNNNIDNSNDIVCPAGYSPPPLLRRTCYKYIHNYFLVANSPEDEMGGYIALREYILNSLRNGGRVVVCIDERRLSRSVRETSIGVLCDAMREFMSTNNVNNNNNNISLGDCYQMVVEAMKGLYG